MAASAFPLNSPEYYNTTDPEQGEWLKTKMTPHPLRCFLDKFRPENPLGNGTPATYIARSTPLFPTNAPSRELAKSLGWMYMESPTGHNAMTLAPEELTGMLSRIG